MTKTTLRYSLAVKSGITYVCVCVNEITHLRTQVWLWLCLSVQLGLGHTNHVREPTLATALQGKNISQISAGRCHSAAWTAPCVPLRAPGRLHTLTQGCHIQWCSIRISSLLCSTFTLDCRLHSDSARYTALCTHQPNAIV